MFRTLTRLLADRIQPKRAPSKLVAILVPISTRPTLSPEEEISVRHLRHYLGQYDKFLISSPDARLRLTGFAEKHFPRKFFGSLAAINHLLYAPEFFRAFEDYRYIFIYHLDSLVFSNQMEYWCDTGLDYIGAPWIPCAEAPWVTRARVGNTGFGLMKVQSALEVLHARYLVQPSSFWLDMFTRNGRRVRPVVALLRRFQPLCPKTKLVTYPIREWDQMQDPVPHGRNCDLFWSDKAISYAPGFKVATLEQGLQFAFEVAPRKCFEMNGGKLPFGCHAWARYDRDFWEPFLLSTNSGCVHSATY